MAYIKPSKPFNQELEKVLAYALFEFGVTTVKRFNQAYQSIRNRLAIHPYSSPKEPLLKSFLRSYRSAIIMKNWKSSIGMMKNTIELSLLTYGI